MLHSENKRRDGEQRDETYDEVYLTQETKDGTQSEKRIDKVRITGHYRTFKKKILVWLIVTNLCIQT